MDNPSAVPSAPDERVRRLGPLNPLTIAVGVVLLTAGGAFGWRMKTGAPSAYPTPAAAAAALALERVDTRPMCADGGEEALREATLRADGGEMSPQVTDQLPRRSPLPGYEKVWTTEIDPASDTEVLSGAVEAHVAAFRPPQGDGGFDVHAYRFLTRQAAASALAGNVVDRVCGAGVTAFGSRGRPGMVVLKEEGRAEWMSAWWTTGSDVMVVRYGGWGDAEAALANLAAIAGATALY